MKAVERETVHIISTHVRAMRRKYWLALETLFEDKNLVNLACPCKDDRIVRTGSMSVSDIRVPSSYASQYTEEMRPNTMGHINTKKYDGRVLDTTATGDIGFPQ